ncbi:MAG: hypothetical protein U5K76_06610 [Woeseiaceae bacterium]|nr:hypothetical protein [Woeseiaceae bacterium]
MAMKATGYLFLVAGFLAGAFSTALDTQAINWTGFVPGALLAAVGVLILKRAARGVARSEHVLRNNRVALRESLAGIVAALDEMIGRESLAGEALRDAIDSELRNDLRRFAEARESLVHLFSLQSYADIMSEFAAGERYVNRVWSASADGYDNEARRYLVKAAAQFRDARDKLESAGTPRQEPAR